MIVRRQQAAAGLCSKGLAAKEKPALAEASAGFPKLEKLNEPGKRWS
jgi:hypothetical protein